MSAQLTDAIIYLRVSSKQQAAGFSVSLNAQEQTCRDYCQQNGLRVVSVHSDVGSGRLPMKLPGLKKAVKELNSSTALVVYKVCRFSRNARDGLLLSDAIHKAGSTIVSATEPFNARTVSGRHTFTILLASAEHESGMIGERVRSAVAYKKSLGSQFGCAPYGKSAVMNSALRIRQFVSCKKEGDIVRFISKCRVPRTRVATLNSLLRSIAEAPGSMEVVDQKEQPKDAISDALSYTNIADLLNEFGVLKRGRPWTGSMVRGVCSLDRAISSMEI